MKSIDKQRATVVYDESLSSEEKEALGDYLETGNEEDYDRFKDIVNERVKRGTTNETVGNVLIKKTEEARVDLEKSGEKYTRKSNIPTFEEFDKNPEKYINKEEMTVPKNLENAEKSRKKAEKDGTSPWVSKDSQGNYRSSSPIVVLESKEKRKKRAENSRNQNNETILPDLDEFERPKETPNDVDLGREERDLTKKEVDLGSNQEN